MLYKNCRILVNDLTEVTKELSMFLEKKVYKFIATDEKYIGIIIDDIIIKYDEDIEWRIKESNEIIEENIFKLDLYNIEEIFDGKDEYIKEIKEELVTFPKELYGKSFISFIQTLSKFIYSDELINEEIDIFGLCKLSNNGKNNIIYRG
jgi:hypothetical protein